MIRPRWAIMLLLTLFCCTALYACGGGGGGSAPPKPAVPSDQVVFSNGAVLSIVPTSRGTFQVQGSSLPNITGTGIAIDYDQNLMSAPTVTVGDLFASALTIPPAVDVPGIIRLGFVGITPVAQSGTIATITFANYSGTRGPTFGKVNLIDLAQRQYSTSGRGSVL